MIRPFLDVIVRVSGTVNRVAQAALACMILLTVADVILRTAGTPIVGTYEMVGLLGAIVVSFAIPFTSCIRGHIRVDFVILKLPPWARVLVNIITRCTGAALFLIIGWHLLVLGMEARSAGEVTPTIHIPLYPIMYGVAVACFFESLVLLCDIAKIAGGEYE